MSEPTGFFHRLGEYVRTREGHPRGAWPWIRRRFLVGILVIFPLGVTILFVRFLFVFLDHWAHPITEQLFGIRIPGLGALLALIALFLLGVLATNVVGSRLLDGFERFIGRLPLLRPIYRGARQVTEAIQLRETEQFRRVVLIPFPHTGVRSVAFVTREFRRPTAFHPHPTVLVFVPTTPNPTSGFLVAVPLADVQALPISVEEGVKLVISGGLLVPNEMLDAPRRGDTLPRPTPPPSSPSGSTDR